MYISSVMNIHTIAVCLGVFMSFSKINFKEKHQAEYQVTHLTQSSLYICTSFIISTCWTNEYCCNAGKYHYH